MDNFTPFFSKQGKICKRNEIHLVSSPKFGGIGLWDQANRVHFCLYFNASATCFIFPLMMPKTKLIKNWTGPL